MKESSSLQPGHTKTRTFDKYNDKGHTKRARRVAVITGSGKGISRSIALEFAKAGYAVMR